MGFQFKDEVYKVNLTLYVNKDTLYKLPYIFICEKLESDLLEIPKVRKVKIKSIQEYNGWSKLL